MTKNITIENKNAVAKKLTEHLDVKIGEISKKIGDIVFTEMKKQIPEDLILMYEKYPNSFDEIEGFWFRHEYFSFYNNKKIPKYVREEKFFRDNEKLVNDIVKLLEEQREIEKNKNQLYNKIRCTLESLKTYKKIEMNFPEAYKVLIEDVEGLRFKDLCTDVEKLRAELTNKK